MCKRPEPAEVSGRAGLQWSGQGQRHLVSAHYLRDFQHGAEATAQQSVTVEQTITIVPVNDAPTLNVPGNKVLKEGSSLAITSGFAVGDIKDTAQGATDFITVTLTAKDGNTPYGTLEIQTPGAATVDWDVSTPHTVKVSGTAAAVTTALNTLLYTPGNTPNMDEVVTINVTAYDHDNGAEDVGVDGNNTAEDSFTITVSSFNDEPLIIRPKPR